MRVRNRFALRWFVSALSLSILLLPHFTFAQSAIRIGGIFCLTGELAMGCNAIKDGALLAASQLDSALRIELDIQDSQFTPKGANTLAKRFAADPSVIAVLITGIIETKAAAPVLERARLPNITLWDSAPSIEEIGRYAFGIGPWLPSSYEVTASFARNKLGLNRAAVIGSHSQWSLTVADGFERVFKELGGAVVDRSDSQPEEADYRSVVAKALAKRPELFYTTTQNHLPALFSRIRQLGFKGPIITSDNISEETIAAAPSALEGAYQSQVSDTDTPKARELRALYARHFGQETTMLIYNAWGGYDGVNLIAEAVRRGARTREEVREQLFSLRDFEGALGEITFTSKGSWQMPVKMFQVRGGRLVKSDD